MAGKHRIDRRTFLKRATQASAAAVVTPMILPRGVLAANGVPGANDRVQVAYIGVGRRGTQIMDLPDDTDTVAYADVYKDRLDKMQRRNKKAKVYQDYRDMLADEAIDAVCVASPDHWHALHSIHAMEAGKDVYVEKPMTLTIRESRLMLDKAREHGRIVQVGSQQRSMKPNREACELIRNGRIGKIHMVHGGYYPSPWDCDFLGEQPTPEGLDWDMWCGPTTPRPYHDMIYWPRGKGQKDEQGRRLGWISFRPYSGGEVTGWGSHGLDQIQWALGLDGMGPKTIEAQGTAIDAPVTLELANGVMLHIDGEGPNGGGKFTGDNGTIVLSRDEYTVAGHNVDATPIARTENDETTQESKNANGETLLYKSDYHLGNWIACVRSRELPVADVGIGHSSTVMCHLVNIARWTQRKLTWDAESERFVNDDEANRHLDRERHEPWTL